MVPHHKGVHGTLTTVMVKADNETGSMMINESDFDPDVHELLEGEVTAKATDWSKKTKAQIMAALDEVKVEYDPEATKALLVEIATKNLE